MKNETKKHYLWYFATPFTPLLPPPGVQQLHPAAEDREGRPGGRPGQNYHQPPSSPWSTWLLILQNFKIATSPHLKVLLSESLYKLSQAEQK